jgi:hypothetical protein
MKIAHFQYVGYPRSGSTFLWRVFQHQDQLQHCATSVVKEFEASNSQSYQDNYMNFDYSINMNAGTLIKRSQQQLQMSNAVTDRYFLCLRNPFEVVESVFAQWNGVSLPDSLVYRIAECADNLNFFQQHINRPFKIFYFDNLVQNSDAFVKNICDYLEISTPVVDLSKILKHSSKEVYHDINITESIYKINNPMKIRTKNELLPQYIFSNQEIEYFNQQIVALENYLERDFSHWKR